MAIIQCPKCNTKFKLPDEKLSSKGVKVRCGKCGYVFVVGSKNKKGFSGKKWLLVLVIFAIVGSGLWIFKEFFYNFDQLRVFREEKRGKVKDVFLEDVKQYFVENEKIGELLVIEGRAVNRSKLPKRLIKLRITLYDKKGRVASRKTIFAGNTLSLYQLQLYTQKQIEDSLNSKIGILTKNSKILPGQGVPFMAVFYNPSGKIAEFTLEITQALTIKAPLKSVK